MVLIHCPDCGHSYRIDKSLVGRRVKCRHCSRRWHAVADGTGTVASADDSVMGSTEISENAGAGDTSVSLVDPNTWIGRQLGRFRLQSVLGKGAMGVVFRAQDPDLRRDVAIKVLTKQFVRNQKRTYRLEQFIREAQSAAKLSHPNSVTVFEINKDHGWYFIAMELVAGGTLYQAVAKKRGRLPIDKACEWIAQAADALSAAHRLGIVHRDVKPSNLMIASDGRLKVTDFGLAQLHDPENDFELPTKAVGTPFWMSPEQCRGESATGASDIYSLGAVLFFVLTGEVPFPGKTKKEILLRQQKELVPDPRMHRKDIPEACVQIIQQCMEKDPRSRYKDAGEMAAGLRQVAQNYAHIRTMERRYGTTSLPATTTPVRERSTIGRYMSTIVLLVVLTAAAVGGWYWYTTTRAARNAENSAPTKTPAAAAKRVELLGVAGSNLYHRPDCPVLRRQLEEGDIDPENVIRFNSFEQAEASGRAPCVYCIRADDME